MTTTVEPAGAANGAKPAGPAADDGRVDAADEALARELAKRAQAEGLILTGPGGLLGRLTKVVLESALDGEMDAHLGYAKHDPAGNGSGNSRNGKRAKTVVTDVGPVQIEVPRDRDSSFEPQIVAKRQRRLGGVDDMVISLVAKGLTTGEVQARLLVAGGQQLPAGRTRRTLQPPSRRTSRGQSEPVAGRRHGVARVGATHHRSGARGRAAPQHRRGRVVPGILGKTIGAIALAEQSPYDAFNPQRPLGGRHPRPFGEPLERGLDD
jgi:hypothetical protein